jgi:ssDNA-binding Zn-finger/Zn-ribbon topoisomerase 1
VELFTNKLRRRTFGKRSFGEKKKENFQDWLERKLDEGIVVDAKLRLKLYKTKLADIRATTILSTFDGALHHGLDFPSEILLTESPWQRLMEKEQCPQCRRKVYREELEAGCPWCDYTLNTSKTERKDNE